MYENKAQLKLHSNNTPLYYNHNTESFEKRINEGKASGRGADCHVDECINQKTQWTAEFCEFIKKAEARAEAISLKILLRKLAADTSAARACST